MKKIFTFILSMCLCCASGYAAGKGASVAATNVFKGKLIQSLTVSDEDFDATFTFTYNDKSQLLSAKCVESGESQTVTFDYTGGSIKGTDYDVKMVIEDFDETISLYITVGDNLFASSVYEEIVSWEDGNSTGTWDLEYNADNQLVKITRSQWGKEVTDISYSNGDITKVEVSENNFFDDSYTFSYTNAIDNTSGFMLYDELYNADIEEMEIAYFAGLLGQPSRHLPDASVDDEGDKETYTWTIDDNGYPSRLIATEYGEYTETFTFTWMENSGIQNLENHDSPVGYYNLQGVATETPSQGIYLIKNSDGSISKVIRK